MSMKKRYYNWCLLPIAGLAACNEMANEKEQKPNIIIILADDMGFSDLGCYGSEIHTPNLDSLAAHGVRCSHFYNSSRSCPSRAALLTGLYPHQAGMGQMSNGLKLLPNNDPIESYQGYFPDNVPTVANLLGSAGYYTCISGKWHVGDEAQHHPMHHGFQRSMYMGAGSNYFSTKDFTISLDSDTGKVYYPDTNRYMTDIIADNALMMLDSVPDDKPFFLYLAFNAPHSPIQAPDTLIEKYMPLYKNGWDLPSKERFIRARELGVIPSYVDETGRADTFAHVDYNWDHYSAKEKWFLQRTMATYAAMIDRLDQNVGRLVEYLRKTGKIENTVIFFMSDNGATNEMAHGKNKMKVAPGSKGFQGAPGPWWGHLSNSPYRMFKAYSSEGGIESPFIAYSPKYFPQNAIIKNAYFNIIDIMPTCLELAGTRYPEIFNGLPVKNTFHQSILQNLMNVNKESDTLSQRLLCWEHQGHIGIRKGRWKLTFTREVYFDNPFTETHYSEMVNQWRLYDLQVDPFENNNVYDKFPEVVAELKKDYAEWAEKTGVVEWERVNIWK